MKGLLIRVDFKGCAIIGQTCDPELDGFGDVEELKRALGRPPIRICQRTVSLLMISYYHLDHNIYNIYNIYNSSPTHNCDDFGKQNNENFSPLEIPVTLGTPMASPWHRGGSFCRASISPVRHRGRHVKRIG